MSNFQAGYVSGVEAAAYVVDALRNMGKTPEEIADAMTELAQRLRGDFDREGSITTDINPAAL